MGELVYQDSFGVKRTMLSDREQSGSVIVHTEVQMDAVLDSIKRDQDAIKPGSVNKVLARVPLTVFEQSMLEGWDDEDWKKWLNDPDNSMFRVWRGRV